MQINISYSKCSTLKKKTSLDLLFLKKKKSYSSNNFLSLYTVLEHPEDTVYNIKYICFGNYKATFFFKKHMPINVNNKFPVFICKTEELCWHHWSRNYGTLIWEDKSNFLVHHEAILIHLWNNDLYDYLKREKKTPMDAIIVRDLLGSNWRATPLFWIKRHISPLGLMHVSYPTRHCWTTTKIITIKTNHIFMYLYFIYMLDEHSRGKMPKQPFKSNPDCL